MARDIYAEVTAKIVAELEAGVVPWVKPWAATPGQNMPCNAVSNRPYSGCNVVLLWMVGRVYSTNRWLTFKQAKELGGSVRKGEHGQTVVFVKQMIVDKDDDKHVITILRAYTVFNVGQCEGLPARAFASGPVKVRNHDERDATIDEFIAATGATLVETNGDRACYRHASDSIEMPKFEGFDDAGAFYATAFHELGHWTGASHRCAREFGKRFGDERYAAEELVVEFCSAYLCAEFSLNGHLQHAAYIGNWIALLKHDKRAFFTAASAAQKAADYLRGKALADENEMAMAA
jgi:antirestriction protein ArdC